MDLPELEGNMPQTDLSTSTIQAVMQERIPDVEEQESESRWKNQPTSRRRKVLSSKSSLR